MLQTFSDKNSIFRPLFDNNRYERQFEKIQRVSTSFLSYNKLILKSKNLQVSGKCKMRLIFVVPNLGPN